MLPQRFDEEQKILGVRAQVFAFNNAFGEQIVAPPQANSDCPPNDGVVDDASRFNVAPGDRSVKKKAISQSDVNEDADI